MSARTGPSSSVEQGVTASLTLTITEAEVQRFAQANGDSDPVHLDHEAIAAPILGRTVAPGVLPARRTIAALGAQLPEAGVIYRFQSVRVRGPVYLGDRVTASAMVVAVDLERDRCVLDGEAGPFALGGGGLWPDGGEGLVHDAPVGVLLAGVLA